jgi:sensor histidine kinase YesM
MILGFLFTLFVVVYYQKRQNSAKIKTLISNQRLLRSQMNPHFIFNSITAIQSYIFKHSGKEAINYLSSFASLMRQIIDSSSKEVIPFDDELKMIQNYFVLQQLRYSNKFSFEISTDEAINIETFGIPPMLCQPFIENAIEHGIKNVGYAGEIKVSFRIDGKLIIVEIADNGIGIDLGKEEKVKKHNSFAVNATKERLKAIHKRKRQKYKFEVIDRSTLGAKQQGTIIRYSMPIVSLY